MLSVFSATRPLHELTPTDANNDIIMTLHVFYNVLLVFI